MPMSHTKLVPVQSFSPLRVPGLGLWLDTSDNATLTMNSSTVSEWRDKSGNARHYTQGTALNQPALSTLNGRQCFTMDGTRWLIGNAASLTLFRNVSGCTIISVYKRTASGLQGLFGWAVGTGTSSRIQHNSSSGSTDVRLLARRQDADGASTITGADSTDSGVYVSRCDFSATSAFVRKNGVSLASSSSFSTAGSTSNTSSVESVVGAITAAGSSPHNGLLAEILAWPRPLTFAEYQYIERGIGRKWGITVT